MTTKQPEPYHGSDRELEDELSYFEPDRTILHRLEERLARIEKTLGCLPKEGDNGYLHPRFLGLPHDD